MPFDLKSRIFGYFGKEEAQSDTYKDNNGKGIFQRYNESLAEDFDEYLLPLIEDVVSNTVDPTTVELKFIEYLESMRGIEVSISDDEGIRRKYLRYALRFADIKGTESGYKLIFALIGVSCTITEHFEYYTLDDPTATLDDDDRRLDSSVCNQPCTEYTLTLTGAANLNPELVNRILSIISYNEPINARLRAVTYNGGPVVQEIINIFVSESGDLFYSNLYDPELILALDSNGNLIISGPNASKYSIDENGDLIFTV